MDINGSRVGLLKTTTVNFPGHLATAVFLPGCNLRCCYCYNGELACADGFGVSLHNTANEYVTLDAVFRHLEKRKNIIKALAISGGEPLLSPLLPALLEKAKNLQYTIKLDTNGLFPERLAPLVNGAAHLLSMVAVDIKTAPNRYGELFPPETANSVLSRSAGDVLRETVRLLERAQSNGIRVEYRTVLVPGLVGKAEIEAIGSILPETADWEFARFLPGTCLNADWNAVSPYTDSETEELLNIAKKFVPNVRIR